MKKSKKRKRRITLSEILREASIWRSENSGDMPISKPELVCVLGQKQFIVEFDKGGKEQATIRIFCQGFGFFHCHLDRWWGELVPRFGNLNRW